MNATIAPPAAPDLGALKLRQQAAWASGNYAVIGTTLQPVGESLAEACGLRWGESVLDVAAGNGNATLAAARRGCRVISTDYVPALLRQGAARAAAEGLEVDFEEADVEALEYADGTFDAVLSTFGVMFAPDHARAAAQMLRVCRPGGRIAMANWTPDGFVGRMFKVLGSYLPPPSGVQSPLLWGTRAHLDALFGAGAASIVAIPRTFTFHYRSAAHFVDVFRTWYGPVHKAFDALPAAAGEALADDLMQLCNRADIGGAGGSLVVPGEYLEIVVVRA